MFLVFNDVGNTHTCFTPSLPLLPLSSELSSGLGETSNVLNVKRTVFLDMVILQLLILILCLIFSQYKIWLHLCGNTYYVPFDTNLSLFKKNKYSTLHLLCSSLWYFLANSLVLILLSESKTNCIHLFLAVIIPNFNFLSYFEPIVYLLHKFRKTIPWTFFVASVILIFSMATTPSTQYLSICVLQILCLSITKEVPPWLSALLILISNDIEQNPGPGYHSNFFTFMNWNLNSLATNDFSRVQLIEAHNSLHNYDLISVCETSLTDSLVPNVPQIEGYTFEPANHPDNVTRGGAGILQKFPPNYCKTRLVIY